MGVRSVSCPVTCVVVKTPGLARRVVHTVSRVMGVHSVSCPVNCDVRAECSSAPVAFRGLAVEHPPPP
eukprot:558599-Rhodomonas_salina.1